ncbi:MAG TPA: ATP-binding cassette domain-containing protein, partial [Gaiellaceae bacterium]|nr:ATP-binding cassette domain-containing protein [Gaiellaceae bacterium]
MSAAPSPLVALRGITKTYGGVHALSDVTFAIEHRHVHALVGENGAGKSTLVKILTGVIQPDDGVITVDGEPQRIADPQSAHRLGIVAMFQEPTVFQDLSVAENVFAGRHPRAALRTVGWRRMRAEASRILTELGV